MKLITLLIAVFFSVTTFAADAPRQLRKWMVDPIRIIDGKEEDLRPFFQWHLNGQRGPSPMPEWELLQSTVDQVTNEGLLIRYPTAFVKNVPQKSAVIDNSYIEILAKKSTPFQFITVLGSTRTVRSYDYGAIPTEKRLLEIKAEEEKKKAQEMADKAAAKQAREEAHKKAVDESKAKLDDLRKRNATP